MTSDSSASNQSRLIPFSFQQETVQLRWIIPLPLKSQTLWKLNLEKNLVEHLEFQACSAFRNELEESGHHHRYCLDLCFSLSECLLGDKATWGGRSSVAHLRLFEHHIWAEEDYYLPELNVPRRINVPLDVTTDDCGSLTSPTQEIRAAFRFLPATTERLTSSF